MTKFISRRVENIIEKEEYAGYQHVFLFRQCYPKLSPLGFIKILDHVVMG